MRSSVEAGLQIVGFAEQLTPLLRSRSDKNRNDIYVGKVMLPREGVRVNAYVKVFLPDVRNQLVFNEVIGQQLASQCALPAPLTFPCACPRSLLRKATREAMARDADCEYILGVASIDGAPGEMRQANTTSAVKVADLMNWPHVARLAVFDELLANDDRHLDNLIRRGPKDYLLIDNERILFGEPWFDLDLSTLRARRCDSNILADTIAEGADQVTRKRMIHLAQQFMLGTELEVPTAYENLEQICSAPKGITRRLIKMLNSRRALLPSLMQWHLRKGDLFFESSKQ
jgi:hypothetical protein